MNRMNGITSKNQNLFVFILCILFIPVNLFFRFRQYLRDNYKSCFSFNSGVGLTIMASNPSLSGPRPTERPTSWVR